MLRYTYRGVGVKLCVNGVGHGIAVMLWWCRLWGMCVSYVLYVGNGGTYVYVCMYVWCTYVCMYVYVYVCMVCGVVCLSEKPSVVRFLT